MNRIKLDISNAKVNTDEVRALDDKMKDAANKLRSGDMPFTDWTKLPLEYDKSEVARIKAVAEEIRSKCATLVVIGIGGSYLGACAVIEALGNDSASASLCDESDDSTTENPKIVFAGTNFSASYHAKLLRQLEDEDVCLCVVSKSGTTTEIAAAFAVFKDMLIRKYGADGARSRIYTITDAEKGALRAETNREGYVSFNVPDGIGGRYSVLTPVGLLPIAVAGIDIEALLAGAADVAGNDNDWLAQIFDYAAIRYIMAQRGVALEIFEYYEPQLEKFAAWVQQLFGESLGKSGKGIFPTSLGFSRDLHSMEQFLQEGNRIFFETVLNVENPAVDIVIPDSAGAPLTGKSLNELNKIAVDSVTEAHKNAGIPMVRINIPELTPFCIGQLIQFMETACAIDGILTEVNPFDQPGVENYKSEMKKRLK